MHNDEICQSDNRLKDEKVKYEQFLNERFFQAAAQFLTYLRNVLSSET